MTVQEMIQKIPELSLTDRKQLIHALVDSITEVPQPQHRLSELRGLGAEIWDGIDAQEYINELRAEWDDRP